MWKRKLFANIPLLHPWLCIQQYDPVFAFDQRGWWGAELQQPLAHLGANSSFSVIAWVQVLRKHPKVQLRDVEAEAGSGSGHILMVAEARNVCRFRFHIIQKSIL